MLPGCCVSCFCRAAAVFNTSLCQNNSPLSPPPFFSEQQVRLVSAHTAFFFLHFFPHSLCLPSPLYLLFSPLVSSLIREMLAWSIGLPLERMCGYGRGVYMGCRLERGQGQCTKTTSQWSLFVICPLRSNTHMHKHTRCAIFSEHPACKWSP